eukprot:jgi/Mesvir1/7402/Mv19198-RA.5
MASFGASCALLMLIAALTAFTAVLGHATHDVDVAHSGAATRSLLASPVVGAPRPVPTLSCAPPGTSIDGKCTVTQGNLVRVLATFTVNVTPVSSIDNSRYNGWLLITNNYKDRIVTATSKTFLFEIINPIPANTPISVCMTAGKVKDGAGRTSEKSNCITVVRASGPVITDGSCPESITHEATASETPVDYDPAPTATSATFGSIHVVCDPEDGSSFTVGAHDVECTATDPVGQTASCAFVVTITDTTAPEMDCPDDDTVPAGSNHRENDDKTKLEWSGQTATDQVDGNLSGDIACTPASGVELDVGAHDIECSVNDTNGNEGSCSFTLTIVDQTAPNMTCPNVTVDASSSHFDDGSKTTLIWDPVTAVDNVDESDDLTIECDKISGTAQGNVGNHTVSCTATDAAENEGECTFTVTVVDTTPPSMDCPDDITEGASGNHLSEGGSPATWSDPSATDNVDGGINADYITCNASDSSLFTITPGGHTVTCSATDEAGNEGECSFTVTIVDQTAPNMTCPNVTVDASSSHFDDGSKTTLIWDPVTAVDNVDESDDLTIECDKISGTAQGNVGNHTVSCTATDAAENEGECTFTVTVVDTTPPSMDCPDDITEGASGNHLSEGGSPATWSDPSATDNVDGGINADYITCNASDSSLFTITPGGHTVTCSATDEAGNEGECSFTVTIVDQTAPNMTCPNVTVDASSSHFDDGSKTTLIWDPVTAVDNVDESDDLTIECDKISGTAQGNVGNHTVSCTATDAAENEGECTFTVTVVDTTPPSMDCPDDITEGASGNHLSEGGSPATWSDPSATDNVDGGINADYITCNASDSSLFTITPGGHTVTCSATDEAGNEGECSFTVTIVDQTAPNMTCPNVTVDASASHYDDGDKTTLIWGPVTAVDNVDESDDLTIECDKINGTAQGDVGNHTVSCTATDAAENEGECTFTVTVEDNLPPDVSCPADFEVSAGDTATWSITASDNVDGVLYLAVVCKDADGNVMTSPQQLDTPDTYAVTCTVLDAAGNQGSCDFEISVVDTTPPSMDCPDNITVAAASNHSTAGGSPASWSGQSATDNVDGDMTANITCDPTSSSLFTITPGGHTVTCSATDEAGNEGECSFTVTIVDNTNPVVTCPTSPVESTAGAAATWTPATALDNVDGSRAVTCKDGGNNVVTSGHVFNIAGTYPITCTATDAAGNQGSCAFTVLVASTPPVNPPVQTICPPNIAEAVNSGTTDKQVTFQNLLNTLNAGNGQPSFNCTPSQSGSNFILGTTAVTCTAVKTGDTFLPCTFTVEIFTKECNNDHDCGTGKKCENKKCVTAGAGAIPEENPVDDATYNGISLDSGASKSGVSIGLVVGVVAGVAVLVAAAAGVIIVRKRAVAMALAAATHSCKAPESPTAVVVPVRPLTPRRGTPRSSAAMHPITRMGEMQQERIRRFRPSDDGSTF